MTKANVTIVLGLTLATVLLAGRQGYVYAAADTHTTGTMTLVAADVLPQIAVAPSAAASEKFAAKELATYLEKIGGRKIAIVENERPVGGSRRAPLIVLGHHPQNAALQPGKLQLEESIIKVEPNRVSIVGGKLPPVTNPEGKTLVRDRGTLYGVYNLLDMLGVRWYRPEPWGEYVPRRDKIVLKTGVTRSRPVYKMRSGVNGYRWWEDVTPEQNEQAKLWATRNRFNTSMWTPPEYGGYEVVDFAHAYMFLIPSKEYYATHPEYFALVKTPTGESKRSDHPEAQLCLGNKEVQDIVAEKIIAKAKANPAQTWFSLEPNDNDIWCQCELCQALDDPNLKTATGKVSMSNRVAFFNNLIARRLAAAVPGAKIAWLAYSYSSHSEAPTLVRRLEPNTVIGAATYGPDYSDYTRDLLDPKSPANQRFVKVLNDHRKLTELFTYEYWSGYAWYGPLPVIDVMADRLRLYNRRFNVQGVYNEFHQSWGPQGIGCYFFARLMWNPYRDVNQELEEYCRNYYGPAAVPMLQYHRLLSRAARNGPYFGSGGTKIEDLFDAKLISQMNALLQQAAAKIGEQEPYRRRFNGVWQGYKVAEYTQQIQQLRKENKREAALAKIDELEKFILADKTGEVFDNGPNIFRSIFRTPRRWRKELNGE